MQPFEYAWVRGGRDCIPQGIRALHREGYGVDVADELTLCDISPGCIVLSEFSGCSTVLTGAITINPFRLEQVTAELYHAATMTWDEQSARAASTLQVRCVCIPAHPNA